MSRNISVIVPVYNGTEAFKKLIASLGHSYSTPQTQIRFIFLDDGSPDPLLQEFYENAFFKRSDVRLQKRTENLGFIKTVNEAIRLADAGADLVILNSDTQVWTRSFEKLQEISLRHPQLGSITPLTNNGTIASLFKWPQGMDTEPYFTPREIAEGVAAAAIASPYTPAPTGVGFCMYIPRKAWELVGELAEVFGKGYGEECDWCQRAIRIGLVHHIATETYVHHSGTESFTQEQKKKQIDHNSILLEERNPGYNLSVVNYVGQRPLKAECLLILSQLIARNAKDRSPTARVFLNILHGAPFNPDGGGTEKHVRLLANSLFDSYPFIFIFPVGNRNFKIQLAYRDCLFVDENFHVEVLPAVLAELGKIVDVLHIHHLLDWPAFLVDVLVNLPLPKKIITVHDYFLLCPSINLLKNRKNFCSVEPNKGACNQCLHQAYGYWNLTIEQYREVSKSILSKVDEIIFPAPAVIPYFQAAFGESYAEWAPKVHVLAHDLSYIPPVVVRENLNPSLNPDDFKKIVFIGHLAKHKGAEVVADALDALLAAGFAPEIWGTYYGERKRKVAAKVPLISFSNEDELLRLFETRKPDLMAFPSIWAETFSYVLYEAVILGQIPVIVGPYGNPADEVRKRNIGSVMPSAEGKSLVWSCKEVRGNYATYVENILKFVQDLKSHPSNYREEYLNLVNRSGQETISQAALLPSHFNLSRMDLLAREREGILVRVALLLQAQLRRFPKVEEVIFDMAREVWRGLQRARDKIRSLLPS